MHLQFFYSMVIANSKLDYYTTSNIIFFGFITTLHYKFKYK